ncbi:MAG: 2-amino-4-oxopentanoate thiolase subunit OrtB [Eubacteriales bacterium]|nr:2-amino-4-oxopentanoate thiolase subunit OrtB [Eubacteriales bacterium]
MRKDSYAEVMAAKEEIIKAAVGLDYSQFERGLGFDYAGLMDSVPYTGAEVREILAGLGVGNTPLIEAKNITRLLRKFSAPGYGARIVIKDEAQNPSGSFKARRAALSVYEAKRLGYEGVVAATSGNYGAAVAAMAAKLNLRCIVVQECYDSRGIGQPEILEKQRACEALGAEVVQLTVGPELFYETLCILKETGFYNASLYTPSAIRGIESLGYELIQQSRELFGKDPDYVIATNAGGGNLSGTARGIRAAQAEGAKVYAASVDLSGLHMASDLDFNRKSFTTGHTGFGIPFTVRPDRSDVPRNAARPLRYLDGYLLVKQGEVFYLTECLAALEGLERGPAGNTSLAAAFALARTRPEDELIIVQETEYTGAGKHPMAQLSFARQQGIDLSFGDPDTEVPGQSIVLPDSPAALKLREYPLENLRLSALRHCLAGRSVASLAAEELSYLAEELGLEREALDPLLEQFEG